MSELESLKKKIIYRANYRGTKEMDILLGKFVDKYVNSFSLKQLEDLYVFLNLEDEIIYNFYQRKQYEKNIVKNEVSEYFLKFQL